jgi:DNA polymerase-3 subunit delta
MKLKRAGEIDALLARPSEALTAVLLFGPDSGLVTERAQRLCDAVLGSPPDPFALTELNDSDLREAPSRLHDEWAALSFSGARKLIRLRSAGDWLAPALSDVLDEKGKGALFVLEAGDLMPRSKLRALAEHSERAVAIGCYTDSSEQLSALVRQMLAQDHLRIEPDSLNALTARLGSDRQLSRREIEKLILYVGPGDAAAPREVRLSDIDAVVGDSDALALDDVVDAALGGEMVALERALTRVFDIGQTPVGVILAVSRQLMRLQFIAAERHAGRSLNEIVKSLRPPVHFARENALLSQASRWSAEKSGDWLTRLSETDAMLRAPGRHAPDTALCSRALYALAQAARR